MAEAKEKEKSPFDDVIKEFVSRIESCESANDMIFAATSATQKITLEAYTKFIDEETEKIETDDASGKKRVVYRIPFEKIGRFTRVNDRKQRVTLASETMRRSLVVSMVSIYDVFLGNLIRVLFQVSPDSFKSSQKTVTVEEILKNSSFDDLKSKLIEEEVESTLRESHLKQLDLLEKKVACTLQGDVKLVAAFIEITERRNLFVHTGGKVSAQYIEVCKANDVEGIENIIAGTELFADKKYIDHCYETLYEFGVKLGQVVWRKKVRDEYGDSETSLNDVCYFLIINKHYPLAIKLLEFATSNSYKHETLEMRMYLMINKAQAYKWSGNSEKAAQIVADLDWSICDNRIKITKHVLLDDFNSAAEIMKLVGSTDDKLNKRAYIEFPIFREFRKSDVFKAAFKEIFDQDYVEYDPFE